MELQKAVFGFTEGWLWIHGRLALDLRKAGFGFTEAVFDLRKAALGGTESCFGSYKSVSLDLLSIFWGAFRGFFYVRFFIGLHC